MKMATPDRLCSLPSQSSPPLVVTQTGLPHPPPPPRPQRRSAANTNNVRTQKDACTPSIPMSSSTGSWESTYVTPPRSVTDLLDEANSHLRSNSGKSGRSRFSDGTESSDRTASSTVSAVDSIFQSALQSSHHMDVILREQAEKDEAWRDASSRQAKQSEQPSGAASLGRSGSWASTTPTSPELESAPPLPATKIDHEGEPLDAWRMDSSIGSSTSAMNQGLPPAMLFQYSNTHSRQQTGEPSSPGKMWSRESSSRSISTQGGGDTIVPPSIPTSASRVSSRPRASHEANALPSATDWQGSISERRASDQAESSRMGAGLAGNSILSEVGRSKSGPSHERRYSAGFSYSPRRSSLAYSPSQGSVGLPESPPPRLSIVLAPPGQISLQANLPLLEREAEPETESAQDSHSETPVGPFSASTSSLVPPRVAVSPAEQGDLISGAARSPTSASTSSSGGSANSGSHSSGLRAAVSKQARFLRNSFMWGSSGTSSSPTPAIGLSPSPSVTPSASSGEAEWAPYPAGHSPAASDSHLPRLPEHEQAPSNPHARLHAPFSFRRSSKQTLRVSPTEEHPAHGKPASVASTIKASRNHTRNNPNGSQLVNGVAAIPSDPALIDQEAPSRPRSRLSRHFSRNDPMWSRTIGKRSSVASRPPSLDKVGPSSGPALPEAVEPIRPFRPTLGRTRSKSVGELPRITSGLAVEESGVTAPSSTSTSPRRSDTVPPLSAPLGAVPFHLPTSIVDTSALLSDFEDSDTEADAKEIGDQLSKTKSGSFFSRARNARKASKSGPPSITNVPSSIASRSDTPGTTSTATSGSVTSASTTPGSPQSPTSMRRMIAALNMTEQTSMGMSEEHPPAEIRSQDGEGSGYTSGRGALARMVRRLSMAGKSLQSVHEPEDQFDERTWREAISVPHSPHSHSLSQLSRRPASPPPALPQIPIPPRSQLGSGRSSMDAVELITASANSALMNLSASPNIGEIHLPYSAGSSSSIKGNSSGTLRDRKSAQAGSPGTTQRELAAIWSPDRDRVDASGDEETHYHDALDSSFYGHSKRASRDMHSALGISLSGGQAQAQAQMGSGSDSSFGVTPPSRSITPGPTPSKSSRARSLSRTFSAVLDSKHFKERSSQQSPMKSAKAAQEEEKNAMPSSLPPRASTSLGSHRPSHGHRPTPTTPQRRTVNAVQQQQQSARASPATPSRGVKDSSAGVASRSSRVGASPSASLSSVRGMTVSPSARTTSLMRSTDRDGPSPSPSPLRVSKATIARREGKTSLSSLASASSSSPSTRLAPLRDRKAPSSVQSGSTDYGKHERARPSTSGQPSTKSKNGSGAGHTRSATTLGRLTIPTAMSKPTSALHNSLVDIADSTQAAAVSGASLSSSSRMSRFAAATTSSKAKMTSKHQRETSRPALSISTQPPAVPTPPPRASTSMGMYGGGQGQDPFASTKARKLSQPTLNNITDDHEFLRALEHVRDVHKQRIANQQAEVATVNHLARMGMAPGNRRAKAAAAATNLTTLGRSASRGRALITAGSSPGSALHRRASSADARLGGKSDVDVRNEVVGELLEKGGNSRRGLNGAADGVSPSPLELGVGKASGKLRDGAFVNDEDWKKEVKALFVIRELLQTERSYARHLESLLEAIRRMEAANAAANTGGPGNALRRKSSMGFVPSYPPGGSGGGSGNSGGNMKKPLPVPAHIQLLRNLLPQLIALSRSLASRIEEDPTASGVAAAFRVVGDQLEATFVGWSAIVGEVMDGLRTAEGPKGKAKDKLGLITLDYQQLEPASASPYSESSTSASPEEGQNNTLEALALTCPSTPLGGLEDFVPTSLAMEGKPKWAERTTKRRSTITSATQAFSRPSLTLETAWVGPKGSYGSGSNSAGINGATGTVTGSGNGTGSASLGRRAMGMAVSRPSLQSKFSKTQPVTPAPSTTGSGSGAKSLSPLDIVIMPTQRIPRYLLLLRDLLSHTTPQSLSHARVQRGLETLKRVAMLCDHAQTTS